MLVPDESAFLVPVSACVFNNAPHIAARIDYSRVRFVSARLSDALCQKLKVPALSSVIEEELCDSMDLASSSSASSPSLGNRVEELVAILRHPSFAESILVIANDRMLRDPDRSASSLHLPSAAQLQAMLSAYQVRVVSAIRTKLMLKTKSTSAQLQKSSQSRASSASQQFVSLDVTRQDASSVLYFVDYARRVIHVCAEPPAPLKFELFVAHALQQIVQKSIPAALRWWDNAAVASLLESSAGSFSASSSSSSSSFASLLQRMHIVPLDQTALRRGVPGEAVQDVDRQFIQVGWRFREH
jgi:hypothetical protein